ncbi:MAG: hypothetical protein V1820_00545 [archaeon]
MAEIAMETHMRKAQNPSFLLMSLIFLVVIVAIAVGLIVSQTQFISIIEEHNQNRFAVLVATRMTGAPDFLIDTTQQQGIHKNILDSRKLDKQFSEFLRLAEFSRGSGITETETPYELRTKCYSWAATVKDSSTGLMWVFGAFKVLPYSLQTEVEEYVESTYDRSISASMWSDAGDEAAVGAYALPVSIAVYEGNQIRKYDFGVLDVFVKKTEECFDEDSLEEEYLTAVSLINKFYEKPRPLGTERTSYSEILLPYIARSDPDRQVTKYLRCEELPLSEISRHFTLEEATLIDGLKVLTASDGTPITEKIEQVSSDAGIDPNLVRAVLFLETGFDPSLTASADFELLAENLKANADYFSGAESAGQCIVNYVAFANVAGVDQVERYIDWTETPDPRSNIRASAERIVYYYTSFSSCWDVEGGVGTGA